MHFEHEPLQLTRSIRIVAHPNIIDLGLPLSNLLQVRTLKTRIKLNCFVLSIDVICHFSSDAVNLLYIQFLGRFGYRIVNFGLLELRDGVSEAN